MTRRSSVSVRHRGVAIVMVIVLLLIVSLIVIGMLGGGARDQALTARRMESVQAMYAAEGGMNMAIREMMVSTDEDGDGAIGTISDDGIAANDPSMGAGQVEVTSATGGGQTTLTSVGRSGAALREVESILE